MNERKENILVGILGMIVFLIMSYFVISVPEIDRSIVYLLLLLFVSLIIHIRNNVFLKKGKILKY